MTSTKQITDHDWVGETFAALTIQTLEQVAGHYNDEGILFAERS